jgi:histidinol-phosphate/aromatic aminotransferase/cobyric acid decarboxylase-like protein
MPRGLRLPLPPNIEAIGTLDDLEDLADEFTSHNGYQPELVSHWDPKPEFEAQIAGWVQGYNSSTSLARYVYSSYLPEDHRIQKRLNERPGRSYLLLPSGTTSMAVVITYLSSVGIHNLHIVRPAYFVAEVLAAQMRMAVSFVEVVRDGRQYSLPKGTVVPQASALLLTFPVYGTSCYVSPRIVASFIDTLPEAVIVIVDESLAYPDRDSLAEVTTIHRVIRIASPHKALCVNGEKVSIVTFPRHLWSGLHAWSECFAGGIGASGLRAKRFLTSDAFDSAVGSSRALCRDLLHRAIQVLQKHPRISVDEGVDGHFIMVYWPHLPMTYSRDRDFMKQIIDESGAVPIPASRNGHPERYGFAFRINLLRLDDAGLGGLSRLARVLDQFG